MQNRYPLILALVLAAGGHAALAQDDAPIPLTSANVPYLMENQGPIESMNLAARTLTLNGVTYPLHDYFETLRHTADGPERLDPVRVRPGMRAGVEVQDGAVLRLHILEGPAR